MTSHKFNNQNLVRNTAKQLFRFLFQDAFDKQILIVLCHLFLDLFPFIVCSILMR